MRVPYARCLPSVAPWWTCVCLFIFHAPTSRGVRECGTEVCVRPFLRRAACICRLASEAHHMLCLCVEQARPCMRASPLAYTNPTFTQQQQQQ